MRRYPVLLCDVHHIDLINKQYGRGTLFSAACGRSLSWKDNKNFLSPSYTTRWDQLAIAYAN